MSEGAILILGAIVLLVGVNVYVWNCHKKIHEILVANKIKEIKIQLEKVEADEKQKSSEYGQAHAQLELDLTDYSNNPPSKR